MDAIEVSVSLENLPALLASMSESLTFYLTGNRPDDSVGTVTMSHKFGQLIPTSTLNQDMKPILKRKAVPVVISSPKKVVLSSF